MTGLAKELTVGVEWGRGRERIYHGSLTFLTKAPGLLMAPLSIKKGGRIEVARGIGSSIVAWLSLRYLLDMMCKQLKIQVWSSKEEKNRDTT